MARVFGRRILPLVFCAAAIAQTRAVIDPRTDLKQTLSDAPLTAVEKDDIYRVIDAQNHYYFSAGEQRKERETVLSSRLAKWRWSRTAQNR